MNLLPWCGDLLCRSECCPRDCLIAIELLFCNRKKIVLYKNSSSQLGCHRTLESHQNLPRMSLHQHHCHHFHRVNSSSYLCFQETCFSQTEKRLQEKDIPACFTLCR